jgi:hypothetical protein
MVRFWQISFALASAGFLVVALFMAAGVDYTYIEENDGTEEAQSNETYGKVFLFVCTPIFLVPTLVFLFIGIIGLLKRRRNRELAETLKSHRRIKVEDFAKKIGKTEMEAEKTIMRVLEDKQIKGYMDRGTGEFFTMDFLEQTPNVRFGWKCPSCGAKNDSVILPGEMGRCKYCETSIPPIGGDEPEKKAAPPQGGAPQAPLIPSPPPPPPAGWSCPACGGRNDSVILPGQMGQCRFCNSTVAPADGPPPPISDGWNCPACGAKNFSFIPPGQRGSCQYCNAVIEPVMGP